MRVPAADESSKREARDGRGARWLVGGVLALALSLLGGVGYAAIYPWPIYVGRYALVGPCLGAANPVTAGGRRAAACQVAISQFQLIPCYDVVLNAPAWNLWRRRDPL